MKIGFLILCSMLLLPGCTSLYMREAAPYQSFKKNLGEQYPSSSLPPYLSKEVWLGYEILPNGNQVNLVGAGGQCVFAFEVDTKARRLTGWRFASKDAPPECMPRP